MPPLNRGHELDEISTKIGELTAYTHEHRHGMNNLSTKFDALALDIAKRVETMNTGIGVRLDGMERRIKELELVGAKADGQKGVVGWLINSPLVGWLVAAAAFILTYLRRP